MAKPVWMPQPGSQTAFLQCDEIFEVLLHGNRASGKGLALDQRLFTEDGWKQVRDITHDDKLLAPDGTFTEIVGIYPQGLKKTYTLTTEGGASAVVDGTHRWSVYDGDNGARYGWIVRDTDWLKQRVDNGRSMYLPLMDAPAPGKRWEGPDPYIAGLILGDGTLTGANTVVYTVDQHTIDYLKRANWTEYDYDSQNTTMMTAKKAEGRKWKAFLGEVSRGDKRVPQELLDADPETRLAVLQGLMDADGSVEKGRGTSASPGGQCSFAQSHTGLCEDVQYLVRSLGGKARIRCQGEYETDRGGKLPRYSVSITHANKFNPFRMPRKANLVRKQKGVRDKVVSIEPTGLKEETICFAVAHPSHLFVCEDFLVTHNTDALIMSYLKHVGKGFGVHWQGIIFRQSYKQLQDVVKKTKKWIPRMFPQATFNETKMIWTFPDGEQLTLGYMRVPGDYEKYHGFEFCLGRGTLVETPFGQTPIEEIKAGDLVSTLEGPRRVKKTFRVHGKRSVRAVAYTSDGRRVGEQVQAEDHPVLTTEGWLCSRSASILQNVVLSTQSWSPHAGGRVSPSDEHPNSAFSFSNSPRMETSDRRSHNAPQNISGDPQGELLSEERPGGSACHAGEQETSTQPRVISRSSLLSAVRKAEMKAGLSGRALLQAQLERPLPEFAMNHDGGGAIFELKKGEGSQADCPSGHGFRDEPARTGKGTVRFAAPQPPGALTPSRLRLREFPHPYTDTPVHTDHEVHVGHIEFEPCEDVDLFDLEVEGCNSYISSTGVVNKNCFVGFEELTTWPTDECYTRIMSCIRSSGPPEMPRVIRATTNPYGCVPYGEVLTLTGWKDIKDVKVGDMVLSVDAEGNHQVKPVLQTHAYDWEGTMVSRRGRGLHMEFTSDHRLPVYNTDHTRISIRSFDDAPNQMFLRRHGENWEGSAFEFELPPTQRRKSRSPQPRKLSSVNYAKLMGWWLTEGSAHPNHAGFSICQHKQHGRDEIRSLLEDCGFTFTETDVAFHVYSADWGDHMLSFGSHKDRKPDRRILEGDRETLQAFYDASMAGDGNENTYYSISRHLADFMAEVGIRLGYSVFESKSYRPDRSPHPLIQVHFQPQSKPIQITKKRHTTSRPAKEKVYCLTVQDTETFFVRQNGCVWLSGNSGMQWVKRRFKLPSMNFKVWQEKETDQNTGRSHLSKPRLAIQSRMSENKILLQTNPGYVDTIRTSARNEHELRAWLFGSWDVVAGGMFADLWEEATHVIPPFKIPRQWRIDRAMDWGSSRPFSIGWYAESNGTPIEHPDTGEVYGAVEGDVFRIGEWYGTNGKPNEGIGLTGSEIGEGMRERELDFPYQGNIHKRVRPGPADHNIFGDGTQGHRALNIHDEMRRSGIRFDKALKGPGSRKAGWQVCRDYMGNALPPVDGQERPGPGLYIFSNCRYFINLIPLMSRDDRDPDDIDTEVEDHIADELRYRLRRIRRAMNSGSF